MKHFKFQQTAVHHIYQRAADKGVIFYTLQDRLVYLTLAASKAKRYGVTILAASIMFTHIHQSVLASSERDLKRYLHDTNTSFARLYNYRHCRKGRLFSRPPGHSQKFSSKQKRTNIIYVFNNHVENKLCKKTTEERWGFLAYALSDNPFSDSINLTTASPALVKAIRLTNRKIRKLKALEYKDLDRILKNLDKSEIEQFADYVISKFAWVDFSAATAFFNDLESLLIAADATTGAEYDINEDRSTTPDTAYIDLVKFVDAHKKLDKLFTLSSDELTELFMEAQLKTSATIYQLRAFFHIS